MASLTQPARRFLHSEWVISNQKKYANADEERIAAERLLSESHRALKDAHTTMLEARELSTKRLDQRVGDVNFWKKEAENILDLVKEQTAALLDLVTRLQKAQHAYNDILHITEECLKAREKRRNIDLVHDKCEKDLVKEVEVIQGILALFTRSLEQTTEQIRLNRKNQYNLEKDIKHKLMAVGVDGHCREMNERSRGTKLSAEATVMSDSSVSVNQWLKFSDNSAIAGEKHRQQSVSLRSVLEELIQSSAQDLKRQVECTDESFRERISETRASKEVLEEELKQIRQLIREMDENIRLIHESIEEKMISLRLAHTRLGHRTHRVDVELARDRAQYSLIDEVRTLEDLLETLRERLCHSERSLRGLKMKRLEMEQEIEIKIKTIHIDEVECMGMRKSIQVHCF